MWEESKRVIRAEEQLNGRYGAAIIALSITVPALVMKWSLQILIPLTNTLERLLHRTHKGQARRADANSVD
ncbi:hypothetical protein Baya_3179 [Bagarius yarrelli]|uniref:Uncharacterized protein n=1 Tax=Bagarius yarrelli TaxID=175774 RepID=A0A556TUN7_BAGYA|nr:hypothetical protein Baya_3179 [Bagarius yarrelli]